MRSSGRRNLRAVCACFVIVVAIALSGCARQGDTVPLVVEDLSYQLLPSGARIVTGQLFNPSESEVAGAQIQVSLFDADNARVGSMSIPVQNIPAGGRVAFRQPVQSDVDVKAARVRSVIVL